MNISTEHVIYLYYTGWAFENETIKFIGILVIFF